MKNNSGISLIVLVVTIAVILILAAVIVLNINSFSNAITDAQKAKLQSDVLSFKNDMELHFSKNPREDFSDFHLEGIDMLTYIPSMEGKSASDGLLYTNGLIIDEGLLKVKLDTFRKAEEEALLEVLPGYSK